LIKRYQEFN